MRGPVACYGDVSSQCCELQAMHLESLVDMNALERGASDGDVLVVRGLEGGQQ